MEQKEGNTQKLSFGVQYWAHVRVINTVCSISLMDSSFIAKVHISSHLANNLAWHLFHALITCSGCSIQFNLGSEENRGSKVCSLLHLF